jgi:hypothetical protein
MTQHERALTRGADVITGTPGASVKREAEAACGADEDDGAAHGTGWGVGAARGASCGPGAACGTTSGSEVPAIEDG